MINICNAERPPQPITPNPHSFLLLVFQPLDLTMIWREYRVSGDK
ncbi:hypothetical protein A5482_014855 (plasmid) [Cyanobacterium sp. IPPAS B-1200]|nr:hypothetical protein [Cyanobacterium sp. IPPAS B-1200]